MPSLSIIIGDLDRSVNEKFLSALGICALFSAQTLERAADSSAMYPF